MVYYFLISILIFMRFKQVFPHVNYAVLEKLKTVDCIIYAMGSLFTSICPSLVTSWTYNYPLLWWCMVLLSFVWLTFGSSAISIFIGVIWSCNISVYNGLLLVELSVSEENQPFTTIMYLECFSSGNCSTLSSRNLYSTWYFADLSYHWDNVWQKFTLVFVILQLKLGSKQRANTLVILHMNAFPTGNMVYYLIVLLPLKTATFFIINYFLSSLAMFSSFQGVTRNWWNHFIAIMPQGILQFLSM